MGFTSTPIHTLSRGLAIWVAIVLAMLGLAAADSLLQKHMLGEQGPLAFCHYLFFLYSPFLLSGVCALLFAPMVAYPFRQILLAKGWGPVWASTVCGVVSFMGSLIAYWMILASWVAVSSFISGPR